MCNETSNKLIINAKITKFKGVFLVEFNYYGYKQSLTEGWLSG